MVGKLNAYIDAIDGSTAWEYRAEEQLDDDYLNLSWALRESLIKNDYSIFQLVAAVFRSTISGIEGEPQARARALTPEYQPGRRIVEDAFASTANDRFSMDYMKIVAAIGSTWMISLGRYHPEPNRTSFGTMSVPPWMLTAIRLNRILVSTESPGLVSMVRSINTSSRASSPNGRFSISRWPVAGVDAGSF